MCSHLNWINGGRVANFGEAAQPGYPLGGLREWWSRSNDHRRRRPGVQRGHYVLVQPWQHTTGSALLGFVQHDADYLADLIATYLSF
jgi:hypothetical protein